MMEVRKANQRGHVNMGWLDSHHTFSFGQYYDPKFMGYRSLRVINDDWVRGGAGFPSHPHRDMEILTYVYAGALEHKDSMGNGSVIRPGDVQRMSAGTGVVHSEYNQSADEPVRFLQIWIVPDQVGTQPGYEQKAFPEAERQEQLRLVASPTGEQGSLQVGQDVRLYASLLSADREVRYDLAPGRGLWLQVVSGEMQVADAVLGAGDGAAVEGESEVRVRARDDAQFLLFDLN